METMSKFKVGNNIVRINDAVYGQRAGFKAIVDANYCYESPNSVRFKIIDKNWELANPKWTIYNNVKPWSQLSDKQKGKLLLAAHEKMLFIGAGLQVTGIALVNSVYKVEEVAKPEPTMAELFMADLSECNTGLLKHIPEPMIAKGWTKSC
jgi:hypothetical protein